jgi:hypothetical protein
MSELGPEDRPFDWGLLWEADHDPGVVFPERGLPHIDNPCRITCTLPRLSLGAGRYLVTLSLTSKYDGFIDALHNAAWFEVGWRNNYANGESYHAIYGPVIMQSTWTTQDAPVA